MTGATGYEIQRWAGSAWETIDADGETGDGDMLVPAGTTTFPHTDIGDSPPEAGEHHTEYYVIRTVSQGGVSSTWSDLVVGRTQPMEVTTGPTLTLVPTGETSVRLTWSPITGATGYLVEYTEGETSGTEFGDDRIPRQSFSALVNPTYRTLTGLKVGTRYTYRITAVLASEAMSAPSAPVQIVTKPATPVLRGSATTANSVELTFPQAILDGDHLGGVPGDYDLQRRVTGGLWGTVTIAFTDSCTEANEDACKVIDSNEPSVLDGLQAGTTYFYRIRVAKASLVPAVSAGAPGSSDNDLTSYWRQIRVRTPNN